MLKGMTKVSLYLLIEDEQRKEIQVLESLGSSQGMEIWVFTYVRDDFVRMKSSMNFCNNEGIARHRTVVATPQQNGAAKRIKEHYLRRPGVCFQMQGLGKDFWVQVVNTTIWLANWSLNISIECKTTKAV